MLLTYSGMYQEHNTNTSKYGEWDYTLSMGVLQERILMIYHIDRPSVFHAKQTLPRLKDASRNNYF